MVEFEVGGKVNLPGQRSSDSESTMRLNVGDMMIKKERAKSTHVRRDSR
jgi:hypothetical protein